MFNSDSFLTVEEAGRLLRLSRGTAYRLANTGELPGVVRVGRSFRVSKRIIEKLLNGQAAQETALS